MGTGSVSDTILNSDQGEQSGILCRLRQSNSVNPRKSKITVEELCLILSPIILTRLA